MISLSRYRFLGECENSPMYLKAFVKSCDVTDTVPDIASYSNAVYIPAQRRPEGDDALYTGAILDANGNPVKHGVLSRHGVVQSKTGYGEATASGGSALYLGWIFPRYGHVLLEALARTWALAGC